MFEYKTTIEESIDTYKLNKLGKEGWELVAVLRVGDQLQLIFKRKR